MRVQLCKLDPRAIIPTNGTDKAAGFDLIACTDVPITIRVGEAATLIPTGLSIYIEDRAVAALILPRSGLGHKQGLVMGNSVGLIDADYQGPWFISAWNRGQQAEIIIYPGDRIAQAIFVPVVHPEFCEVKSFSDSTVRGGGGYGSTGIGKTETVPGPTWRGSMIEKVSNPGSGRVGDRFFGHAQ